MGNSKFKLSDMIPNAWFYKLKDMGKNNTYRNKKKSHCTPSSSSSLSNSSSLFSSSISTSTNSTTVPSKTKEPRISHHRESYYFTRELSPEESKFPIFETKLPNSPVKSPKQRIRNRGSRASCGNLNSSSLVLSDCESSFSITNFKSFDSSFDIPQTLSENKALNSITTKLPDSMVKSPKKRARNRVPNSQVPVSPGSENSVFNANFKISDIDTDGFYSISKTKLAPIITKKNTEAKKEKKVNAPRKQRSSPIWKHSGNSTGVRLRPNSPRIGKINESGRKSFSSGRQRKLPESFAVVKKSSDPQKDFRESMVEMILQNNINGSKELEELLACYLQLNCDEYHEMIIKVFKQIWFEIVTVRV